MRSGFFSVTALACAIFVAAAFSAHLGSAVALAADRAASGGPGAGTGSAAACDAGATGEKPGSVEAPMCDTHMAEAPSDDPDSGAELIGKPAPAWAFERWIRTKPLSLEALRGKVVLLRWWTEGCHFCRATLPALERVQAEHGRDGLVVIGVFHPKPPREVSDRHILAVADDLGFSGPIAVDTYWPTLDRYWFDGHPERNWTSVSFLIDRNGLIRWVHGGGEYHPSTDPRHARCDLQWHEFQRVLSEVLAEKQTAATSR